MEELTDSETMDVNILFAMTKCMAELSHGLQYIHSQKVKQRVKHIIKTVSLYEKEIEEWTSQFARVENIKKFKLLADVWSQETSELTPTLKVKRRIIEEKYKELIDEMY